MIERKGKRRVRAFTESNETLIIKRVAGQQHPRHRLGSSYDAAVDRLPLPSATQNKTAGKQGIECKLKEIKIFALS